MADGGSTPFQAFLYALPCGIEGEIVWSEFYHQSTPLECDTNGADIRAEGKEFRGLSETTL